MDPSLAERIDRRAYVIIGAHSEDRDESDPAILEVLKKALKFCEVFEPKLGPPSVSGGTTSTPNRVLMLYWEAIHGNIIGGVYVTFLIDGFCDLEWSDSKSLSKSPKLPFDQLMQADIVGLFKSVKKVVTRDAKR